MPDLPELPGPCPLPRSQARRLRPQNRNTSLLTIIMKRSRYPCHVNSTRQCEPMEQLGNASSVGFLAASSTLTLCDSMLPGEVSARRVATGTIQEHVGVVAQDMYVESEHSASGCEAALYDQQFLIGRDRSPPQARRRARRGWRACRKACQYRLRYQQPYKCGLALISLRSVNTDLMLLHQVRICDISLT